MGSSWCVVSRDTQACLLVQTGTGMRRPTVCSAQQSPQHTVGVGKGHGGLGFLALPAPVHVRARIWALGTEWKVS